MANGGEDSRALQEFRRNFFGISREHAPMPESYLRELQRLVGAASGARDPVKPELSELDPVKPEL